MKLPFRLRLLLAVAILAAPSALGAQRLALRVNGADADTAYLALGDAVTIKAVGKTAAGGTVVPTSVSWGAFHCASLTIADPPTAATLSARDCWPVPQWLTAEGVVTGARVRDSVWVAP